MNRPQRLFERPGDIDPMVEYLALARIAFGPGGKASGFQDPVLFILDFHDEPPSSAKVYERGALAQELALSCPVLASKVGNADPSRAEIINVVIFQGRGDDSQWLYCDYPSEAG